MTSHIPQSKCYAGERVLGRAVVTVHVLSSAGVTSPHVEHRRAGWRGSLDSGEAIEVAFLEGKGKDRFRLDAHLMIPNGFLV